MEGLTWLVGIGTPSHGYVRFFLSRHFSQPHNFIISRRDGVEILGLAHFLGPHTIVITVDVFPF